MVRHLSEIFSDTRGHAFKYSATNVNVAIDLWGRHHHCHFTDVETEAQGS